MIPSFICIIIINTYVTIRNVNFTTVCEVYRKFPSIFPTCQEIPYVCTIGTNLNLFGPTFKGNEYQT